MKQSKHPPLQVAEFQGLYGPFSFPEKLLQKIWLLGLFDRQAARLDDGTPLEVLTPGRWNLLGGPDFRGANLRLGGRDVSGDVEVHFHAADWAKHGHDRDPAYAGVVLHVVLFEPPAGGARPRRLDGREIPQLVLLPWLHCHLEEFAADDAIEALVHRHAVQLAEALLELPRVARLERLRAAAERRWKQKVHFAEVRLARLGWEEACHHTALEILGYRFNRAPMLAVAGRFPLRLWRERIPASAELWATGEPCWRRQGVRPANHPRHRLDQYCAWIAAASDWPARWLLWRDSVVCVSPENLADVAKTRREYGFPAWRDRLAQQVVGGAVSGARLDTLITNGLLPLLAAQSGERLFDRWFAWYPGEVPERLTRALRLAGICGRGAAPLHVGAVQAMLQLSLDQPDGFGSRD